VKKVRKLIKMKRQRLFHIATIRNNNCHQFFSFRFFIFLKKILFPKKNFWKKFHVLVLIFGKEIDLKFLLDIIFAT